MQPPEGWNKARLGDHIDLLTGYPFRSDEYTDDPKGIRLLRGDNVSQGRLRWSDAVRWPEPANPADDGLSRYRLELGDLVIAMDRTWVKSGLKYAIVQAHDVPSFLVQRVARLRGIDDLTTDFLSQVIHTHRFVEYVKCVQTETAIPHISAEQLRDFPILLPPLHEQQVISCIGSRWDNASERTSSLIKLKQLRLRGLMQQLLTGRRRLPAFADRPWEEMRLGTLTSECTKRNAGFLGVERVMAVNKLHGIIPMRGRTIGADLDRYKIVPPGAFAYNPMRINIGSIARSHADHDVLVSPDYVVFESTGCDPSYLEFFRRSEIWRRHLLIAGNGSVRVRIYYRALASMKVRMPDRTEQRAIAEVLDTAQQEINLLKQLREQIQIQKRGLMQKLLTGKIRVPISELANG